jgi:hypothetical protein
VQGALRCSLLLDTFPGIVIYYYAGEISQAFLPIVLESMTDSTQRDADAAGHRDLFFPV